MSQIPGIGGTGSPGGYHDKPSRPYYKDSDSQYVRLAKEGGVKNLLAHEENSSQKDVVTYNKNNWFYLEDNAVEDAKVRKNMNWTFGVPDYMGRLPEKSKAVDSKDVPDYASAQDDGEIKFTDMQSAKGAGVGATPERPAAGLDCNRPVEIHHPFIHSQESPFSHKWAESDCDKPAKWQDNAEEASDHKEEPIVVAHAREPQWTNPITQNQSFSLRTAGRRCCSWEDAGTTMSKLLSFGYAQDWHDRRDSQEEDRKAQLRLDDPDSYPGDGVEERL